MPLEQTLANNDSIDELIEEIKQIIAKNYPKSDLSLIDKAYQMAKKAHGQQKRRSGEPYIMHPVNVAYILATYHMDLDTIIAALLHDVIEDTELTFDDLAQAFNPDIANMVESVSKMTRLSYQSKEESQAEYLRKMVLSMADDLRIIIIKLVDRLHNMRTLEYMSSSKQIEKSKETLDIYAPIANRLGIQSIKAELEDLAFKYLNPKEYYNISNGINMKKKARDEYINRVVKEIQEKLKAAGVKAEIYGRTKHFYSIYKKMKTTDRSFQEIYDVFAVRIITNTVEECYAALGIIHLSWNAMPYRMKDYITRPKSNGYQSLHTTVVGPEGSPLEIQIRTKEMHEINEYGVAAHWKYKEGKKSNTLKERRYDENISWLRHLLDWTKDAENAIDFLESVKVDILNDEVYVYTPTGKVIELPVGSCPIDFAYRIHTDIGNHCIGAKVNQKLVPLNYQLNSGDIVEIKTNKNSRGPSRDWLNYIKSAHARNKIRQFFKKEEREENILRGKAILETEIKKIGSESEKLLVLSNLEKVAQSLGYKNLKDLYLSLGVSSIKMGAVIQKMELLFPELFPQPEEEIKIVQKPKTSSNQQVVLINNIPGIETHLAKCCNPIPGDDIIGYTTRTKGISIHRTDCPNILKNNDSSRIVNAKWNTQMPKAEDYESTIFVETYTKQGGLLDIVQPFYDLNITITSTSSRTDNNLDFYEIGCQIKDTDQLNTLIKEIRKVPEVIRASR